MKKMGEGKRGTNCILHMRCFHVWSRFLQAFTDNNTMHKLVHLKVSKKLQEFLSFCSPIVKYKKLLFTFSKASPSLLLLKAKNWSKSYRWHWGERGFLFQDVKICACSCLCFFPQVGHGWKVEKPKIPR